MAAAILTTIDARLDMRLLRLLHLSSPTLPVGAFAYSQGMEWAVEAGWLKNAATAAQWIGGLLSHGLGRFDVPIFRRLYDAWEKHDRRGFDFWSRYLLAGRGSSELQQEERSMGRALLRLLLQLQPNGMIKPPCIPTFIGLFAAAACNWSIEPPAACIGLLWSWCENQVAAAVKLIPLGQTDGQRILTGLADQVADAVASGLVLDDAAIGAGTPGQSLASAMHETQHTRLFRS
jgi:urease accessory protein